MGEWNPVPGYSGYAVNSCGQIMGPHRRVLRPMVMPSGHLYVLAGKMHRDPDVPRKLFVHRAVLFAFVGPPGKGQEGRHLDGDSTNNRSSNLAWGDRLEQRADDRRNGVDRHSRVRKLTMDQVAEIRCSRVASRPLAKIYKVSHTTIQKIRLGERYG